MKMTFTILAALVVTSVGVTLHAQVKERPIPRIIKKDGRYALLVDGAPYLMLGAQVHNSSDWPAMFPKVWPAMEYLNVNAVEIPVYWEQFEPRQGQSASSSRHSAFRPSDSRRSGWITPAIVATLSGVPDRARSS